MNKIIRDVLSGWIKECHIRDGVAYDYDYGKHVVTIYTNRPGVMIGLSGITVYKYERILNKRLKYTNFVWRFSFKEIYGGVVPYVWEDK